MLVRPGHGPDHERVQVLELTPYLNGRNPAADAGRYQLAPPPDNLLLMVAHVRGYPALRAVNVHGYTCPIHSVTFSCRLRDTPTVHPGRQPRRPPDQRLRAEESPGQ